MQAALAWWSTVSPFSPFGPTIALLFVLLVAAVKAAIEDKKRHREDRLTNNSIAHLVNPDGDGTSTRLIHPILLESKRHKHTQILPHTMRITRRDGVFVDTCMRC